MLKFGRYGASAVSCDRACAYQTICHGGEFVRRTLGSYTAEQVRNSYVKGTSDFLDVYERDIFLCPLNHTYISVVHVSKLGQPFLRDASLRSYVANTVAKVHQYI